MSASHETLATPSFLNQLRSLYPSSMTAIKNPWYIIAAVAFSACNRPEEVPRVCLHALQDIEKFSVEEKIELVERIRDALFKSGMTASYSKVINALVEIKHSLPPELTPTTAYRDQTASIAELSSQGSTFFTQTYGPTASTVQPLLDSIYPDLGFFSQSLAYGFTYSFPRFHSPVEISFILVAALISVDTPRQIKWHLDGAKRNGASEEEVRAVRRMAMEVVRVCGVQVRNEVPDV